MTENMKFDLQDRMQTRERLKIEKPVVYEKLIQLDQKLSNGENPPPNIEIAYRFDCNIYCSHCFATKFTKKKRSLSLMDLREISQQANEMGVYQYILQGGEPLFWPDLDDVLNAINPKEFYMGLVTNATLLTKEKVVHLRNIGIDKIVMSLDSFHKGQKHTIDMFFHAKEAGLRVVINTVATKQNVRSHQLLELIDFVKKHGFILYVNGAAPIGEWEGRYDHILDEDDQNYIYNLNLEHEVVKRDTFPYKGINKGCPAFREVVYITEYGDVCPCPFLHMSAGNIFEEPLSQIIEKGLDFKAFKIRPKVCPACDDKDFIKNTISRMYGKPSPMSMKELFSGE